MSTSPIAPKNSAVSPSAHGEIISAVLRSDLTNVRYDLPLTLKTQVPDEWKTVEVQQGEKRQQVDVIESNGTKYVLYQAVPNAEVVKLSRVEQRQ